MVLFGEIYLVVAVATLAVTLWAAENVSQNVRQRRGYRARQWVLSAVCAVSWPAFIALIVLATVIPAGRVLVERIVFGPAPT